MVDINALPTHESFIWSTAHWSAVSTHHATTLFCIAAMNGNVTSGATAVPAASNGHDVIHNAISVRSCATVVCGSLDLFTNSCVRVCICSGVADVGNVVGSIFLVSHSIPFAIRSLPCSHACQSHFTTHTHISFAWIIGFSGHLLSRTGFTGTGVPQNCGASLVARLFSFVGCWIGVTGLGVNGWGCGIFCQTQNLGTMFAHIGVVTHSLFFNHSNICYELNINLFYVLVIYSFYYRFLYIIFS